MALPAAPRRRFPWPLALLVVLLGGGAAGFATLRGGDEGPSAAPVWKVTRGPLRITVTEGGSLQSLQSNTLCSEVEGETKILSVVAEGAYVTPEDVAAGKVLVELDSSDLEEKRRRQTITVSDVQSNVLQAQEALKIQENQTESDLRKSDLDVRFARMDLQKYVGTAVAARVEAAVAPDDDAAARKIDFAPLAKDEALDGESLQESRRRGSDIDLAKEEVVRARDKLRWTEELLAKGYVSQDEEVADRLNLKRQDVALEQANTALALFLNYDFPKRVERLASDLHEKKEAYERVQRQGQSTLMKARADLKGKQERLDLETADLRRIERQIAACVIRARNPGLVVYATSEDRGNWMGEGSPIQQGASVRERQPILSIPDPRSLGVRINVHESALERVKVGQEATVVVDAFSGRPLAGRVLKVSTMPSAANRWQNPDLKVYATDVAIDDPPAELRPGMSARVEIQVEEVPSALCVPLQAVATSGGRPAVWVRRAEGDVACPVRLGPSNERFTQVLEGLSEGDLALLAPPKEARPIGGGRGPGGPGGARPGRGPRSGPSGGAPAAGSPARDAKPAGHGTPASAGPQRSPQPPDSTGPGGAGAGR